MNICRLSKVGAGPGRMEHGTLRPYKAGIKNCIMANNRLAGKCHLPGDTPKQPTAPGANDILGRIQVRYVSPVVNLFPPAASST